MSKNPLSDMLFVTWLALFFFSGINHIFSQTTSDAQLWMDAELNYTHKNKYLFQNEVSAQTLLAGDGHWFSLSNTMAFEWNLNPHIDLMTSVPFSYTHQQNARSTYEIRTMVGSRIYFTPTLRPQVRLLLRFEERWAYDNNTEEWDIGNRFRIRGEFIYPLNKNSYFEDNMWYGLSYAEIFLSTSKDISERFANRSRFSIGCGYRLTYKLRFEGIYTCQFSRNTIDDDFDSVSNIIRLRLKYYFK